jgi:hypothetical protein
VEISAVGYTTAMKQCNIFSNSEHGSEKCKEKIQLLQQKFISHFQDICTWEATFNLISVPFDINVETVSAKFKIKMINFQCDKDLRNTYQHI